jgi:hypothetical protein
LNPVVSLEDQRGEAALRTPPWGVWVRGQASVREIQEGFSEPRPAYTTVQTTVYRLEAKGALRRTRRK